MKYEIKEVRPDVFAIIVPDSYDRAMLFLRVQEYYENPTFKGTTFSIWDFIKEYSKDNKFTYAHDWDGFNVPYSVAEKCYNETIRWFTPYDDIMIDIIDTIGPLQEGCIIGVDSLSSETFEHEIRHSEYLLNKQYRRKANELIKGIDRVVYKEIADGLLSMGYDVSVLRDEIQAYICTNYIDLKGNQDILKELHNLFVKELKLDTTPLQIKYAPTEDEGLE